MDLKNTRTTILAGGDPEAKRREIRDYFHATFDIDEQLYATRRKEDTRWTPWERGWNAAPLVKGVASADDAHDALHVWGIGTDGQVYLDWRRP